MKERLDLSPQLRDARRSRRGDRARDPGRSSTRPSTRTRAGSRHTCRQKLDERLQAGARRTRSLDLRISPALVRQLEFFDLRELHDAITEQDFEWRSFEPRIPQQGRDAHRRFDQLAGLRERDPPQPHCRARSLGKKGEAALLWFEQVLAKKPEAQAAGG